MKTPPSDALAWTDEHLETVLAAVLRFGVLLSACLVAVGGAVYLSRHALDQSSYHVFQSEPEILRSVHGIVTEAMRADGSGVIQLGLLVLIATPIARVLFSVVGFVRQRDWLYVGITMLVLALLAVGLFG
jgi:uncharacterized membrane protein